MTPSASTTVHEPRRLSLRARLLPQSLSARVFALFAWTLLLIIGLALGGFINYQHQQQISDLNDEGSMLVEVAAQPVSDSAVIGDYDQIKRILETLVTRSHFANAQFIDVKGGKLVAHRRDQPPLQAPAWLVTHLGHELGEINRTIKVGGVDYGVLRLSYDLDVIAGSFFRLVGFSLGAAFFGLLAGLGVVLWSMKRWLGTLDRIKTFEHEIRTGALPANQILSADAPLEIRRAFEVLHRTAHSLQIQLHQRDNALAALRELVRNLQVGPSSGAPIDRDDLEGLTRLIAELVNERERSRQELDNQKFALDQHAIVSITDARGLITYANEKFLKISGMERDDLLGKPHSVLSSGLTDEAVFSDLWATIERGQVWQGEVCNRARDGAIYWLATTIVPLPGPDGKPDRYIAISTNITSSKASEAALRVAKEIAESANRAKSDFLANMSHEIRTPMNGILGMTDLALELSHEQRQREYLGIVKNSAETLLTIIDDVLDFSKIEAGMLRIEQVPFSPVTVITETVQALKLRAEQKALALDCQIDPSVPFSVIGDPVRLRQILTNLLGNAIKFTERGQIVLRARAEPTPHGRQCLWIDVQDTGIGIAPEQITKIFDTFVQEDASTTRKYGGTGLGLSICKRLVQLMGGDITVSSMPHVGSVFRFSLDVGVHQPVPVLSPAQPQVAPSDAQTQPSTPALRVLLVEDNPVNQMLAQALLQRWGHRVMLAHNGEQGVDLFEAGGFDLVLMDMQMPVMDGLEATRKIRAIERVTGQLRTPIFAMTANAMNSDREACLDAGMDDFIAKPVRAEALRTKLAALAPFQKDGLATISQ